MAWTQAELAAAFNALSPVPAGGGTSGIYTFLCDVNKER